MGGMKHRQLAFCDLCKRLMLAMNYAFPMKGLGPFAEK